ncbi:MAG: hypothetical protein AB8F95_01415, partial [Bacteroidia bacterium]
MLPHKGFEGLPLFMGSQVRFPLIHPDDVAFKAEINRANDISLFVKKHNSISEGRNASCGRSLLR